MPAAAVFKHAVTLALADPFPFPFPIAIALPVAFPGVRVGVPVGVGVNLGLDGRPERRSQCFLHRRPVAVGVVLGLGVTFAIGVRCSVVRCSVVVRDFIVGSGHGPRVTRRLPRDEPESEREH